MKTPIKGMKSSLAILITMAVSIICFHRCGTQREEEGVFTNTIVIQHHPIIQQKGDRAIKLYCFFEISGDKVVTNSYDVITE